MPDAALRLSAGMLPPYFLADTVDPINLQGARLQDVIVSGNEIWLVLSLENGEESRTITIQYESTTQHPKVDNVLLSDNSDSEVLYHEFHDFIWFYHDILFAGGVELRVDFSKIEIKTDGVV